MANHNYQINKVDELDPTWADRNIVILSSADCARLSTIGKAVADVSDRFWREIADSITGSEPTDALASKLKSPMRPIAISSDQFEASIALLNRLGIDVDKDHSRKEKNELVLSKTKRTFIPFIIVEHSSAVVTIHAMTCLGAFGYVILTSKELSVISFEWVGSSGHTAPNDNYDEIVDSKVHNKFLRWGRGSHVLKDGVIDKLNLRPVQDKRLQNMRNYFSANNFDSIVYSTSMLKIYSELRSAAQAILNAGDDSHAMAHAATLMRAALDRLAPQRLPEQQQPSQPAPTTQPVTAPQLVAPANEVTQPKKRGPGRPKRLDVPDPVDLQPTTYRVGKRGFPRTMTDEQLDAIAKGKLVDPSLTPIEAVKHATRARNTLRRRRQRDAAKSRITHS